MMDVEGSEKYVIIWAAVFSGLMSYWQLLALSVQLLISVSPPGMDTKI